MHHATNARPLAPLGPIALACASLLLGGCAKKAAGDAATSGAATAAAAPAQATAAAATTAAATGDVAFKGTYTKYAEAEWKNGRRFRVANSNGTATIVVDSGKVTYAQQYTLKGQAQKVTQVYTFTTASMKPLGGGSFDVSLTWQSIEGDTKSYSPDKNKPILEVRHQGSGYEIGLVTTDNNGVMGGVEFK
jgi:hypothetical protein